MRLPEERQTLIQRIAVLQVAAVVLFVAARRQLLGPAGRPAREVPRRWRRTTTSGRSRCARRAACCSTATAACSSRTGHSFSISIVREHTKESRSHHPRCSPRWPASTKPRVQEIVDRHRREPTYRPIVVIEDATLAQVAAITARRLDFELPDVVVEQVPTRQYPDDELARAPVRLRRRGQRRAGRAETTR